jgi:hypothetical protein
MYEQQFRNWLRSRLATAPECGHEIFASEFEDLLESIPAAALDRLVGLALSRGWLRSVAGVAAGLYVVTSAITRKDPPNITAPKQRAVLETLQDAGELTIDDLATRVWGSGFVDDQTVHRTIRRLSDLLLEHDPHGLRIECQRGVARLIDGADKTDTKTDTTRPGSHPIESVRSDHRTKNNGARI